VTAGIFICLQIRPDMGGFAGRIAVVHGPAHKADFRLNLLRIGASIDAHLAHPCAFLGLVTGIRVMMHTLSMTLKIPALWPEFRL
jgi:hypothetical protein